MNRSARGGRLVVVVVFDGMVFEGQAFVEFGERNREADLRHLEPSEWAVVEIEDGRMGRQPGDERWAVLVERAFAVRDDLKASVPGWASEKGGEAEASPAWGGQSERDVGVVGRP
jgi:hypothetical protein